jgi:hypothetical protein
MPIEGCGERHLFLCARTKYLAAAGVRAARATGGGVYSIRGDGESNRIDDRLNPGRAAWQACPGPDLGGYGR